MESDLLCPSLYGKSRHLSKKYYFKIFLTILNWQKVDVFTLPKQFSSLKISNLAFKLISVKLAGECMRVVWQGFGPDKVVIILKY